jgi:mandelate racemase
VALVAEGGFQGLKLRLGRECLADDFAAIKAVRGAVGENIKLMVDFNHGLALGDALRRWHARNDQGLYWFEEPIAYDNLAGYAQLTRELKTSRTARRELLWPGGLFDTIQAGAGDYVMPDLIRIAGVTGWFRAAAIAGAAGVEMSTHLYPEIAGHLMRFHPNRALARMTGLG